jgi:GlcNAc-P-P-Und epimerase
MAFGVPIRRRKDRPFVHGIIRQVGAGSRPYLKKTEREEGGGQRIGGGGLREGGEWKVRTEGGDIGLASKWQAEQLVREWAAEDLERSALILRPAVVYGPGNTANLFSMVDALARGRFCLVGRNDNIKSLVSLKNLCAAVVHLSPQMKPGVEVYNLVDEQSYSVRELASMMARLLGVKWNGSSEDGGQRTEGRGRWTEDGLRSSVFRLPRSLPLPVAKGIAWFGDAFTRLTGKSFPLTTSRLEALLETTHFSCEKLLATGFRHPQSTEEGIGEMVRWYRGRGKVKVEGERESGERVRE